MEHLPGGSDKGTLDLPPVVGQFYGKRGNFTISKPGRAVQSLCAMSGSTFRLSHREWNSPFRQTAERHGKLTGYVNSHDEHHCLRGRPSPSESSLRPACSPVAGHDSAPSDRPRFPAARDEYSVNRSNARPSHCQSMIPVQRPGSACRARAQDQPMPCLNS